MFKDRTGKTYYTVKEIAKNLCISDRTVYAWIRQGIMKAVPYGRRRWVVNEVEIKRFLKEYNFDEMQKIK